MKGFVAGSRIVYEPPTGRELLGSVEQKGRGGGAGGPLRLFNIPVPSRLEGS